MKLQHELTFFFQTRLSLGLQKHQVPRKQACYSMVSLNVQLRLLRKYASRQQESDGFMWRASKIWSRSCITLRASIGAEKLNLRSSKEALVFRSHDRNMHLASSWGVGCAASASSVFPGTFKWCLASKKIQRILIFKTR